MVGKVPSGSAAAAAGLSAGDRDHRGRRAARGHRFLDFAARSAASARTTIVSHRGAPRAARERRTGQRPRRGATKSRTSPSAASASRRRATRSSRRRCVVTRARTGRSARSGRRSPRPGTCRRSRCSSCGACSPATSRLKNVSRPHQHRRLCRHQRARGRDGVPRLPRHDQRQPRRPQSDADPDPRRRPDRLPAGRGGQGQPAVGARAEWSVSRSASRSLVLLMSLAFYNDLATALRLAGPRSIRCIRRSACGLIPARPRRHSRRCPRAWHGRIPCPDTAPAEPGEFTVGDIRVEGLQRISEGTVFNYLPVNIGDQLDPPEVERGAARAVRDRLLPRRRACAATATRCWSRCVERPSIESFEIKGNKDIKTEDLQKSLRNVGLATGKTFDRTCSTTSSST